LSLPPYHPTSQPLVCIYIYTYKYITPHTQHISILSHLPRTSTIENQKNQQYILIIYRPFYFTPHAPCPRPTRHMPYTLCPIVHDMTILLLTHNMGGRGGEGTGCHVMFAPMLLPWCDLGKHTCITWRDFIAKHSKCFRIFAQLLIVIKEGRGIM